MAGIICYGFQCSPGETELDSVLSTGPVYFISGDGKIFPPNHFRIFLAASPIISRDRTTALKVFYPRQNSHKTLLQQTPLRLAYSEGYLLYKAIRSSSYSNGLPTDGLPRFLSDVSFRDQFYFDPQNVTEVNLRPYQFQKPALEVVRELCWSYLVTGTSPVDPKYTRDIPLIAHNPDESRKITMSSWESPS